MTTSITDARFTSLHFTPGHLLSLSIDDPPETGWSVMPGYDQMLPIPPHLEPPRMDADETLPSQMHPSYPYGRPPTVGKPIRPWMSGPGNLLGTVSEQDDGFGRGSGAVTGRNGELWEDLGMRGVVEAEHTKEIPPGMAGAKRPPSPPSPSLHPTLAPSPRSEHLRKLYARQRQANPSGPPDPFDAPVPNETYAGRDEEAADQQGEPDGMNNGVTGQTSGMQNQPQEDRSGDQEMDEEDGE